MTAMNDTQLSDYVTFTTAEQIFGLPIECVQDVFKPSRITRVPLAGPEIAGVLNLRGRIVTAIRLSNRLDLESKDLDSKDLDSKDLESKDLESRGKTRAPMAIGIEA